MPTNLPIEGGKDTGRPPDWNEAEHGPCHTISVLYQRDGMIATMTTAWAFSAAEWNALNPAAGGALFLTIYGQQHPVIGLVAGDLQGNAVVEPGSMAMDLAREHPVDLLRAVAERTAADLGLTVDHQAFDQAREIADAPADQGDTSRDLGDQALSEPAAEAVDGALDAMMEILDRQASEGRSTSPDIGEVDEIGQVWMSGTFNLRSALAAALEIARPHIPPVDPVAKAARNLLRAFGGDTPHWIRPQAIALENALEQARTYTHTLPDQPGPTPARDSLVEIPIKTLDSIAAEGAAEKLIRDFVQGEGAGAPLGIFAEASALPSGSDQPLEEARRGARDPLAMWVVTTGTSDFPAETFVARKHLVDRHGSQATAEHFTGDTLEEVQQKLTEMGLGRVPRHRDDDPVILESWV